MELGCLLPARHHGQLGRRAVTTSPAGKARYAAALDAVADPVTNLPVGSSADQTDQRLPSYKPMGINVNSPEAIAELIGSPYRDQRFTQEVVAATLRGEPFESWAGPLSIAMGVERREEKVRGESDPDLDDQRLVCGQLSADVRQLSRCRGLPRNGWCRSPRICRSHGRWI